MARHIRTGALAVTFSTIVATALVSAGASADTLVPRAAAAPRTVHHQAAAPRHHPRLYGITRPMMTAAARVSRCEEGGNWHFVGTSYDGGIGWTPANWDFFRKASWPRFMHDAPPRMQANALYRFVRYYQMGLPDQNGTCAGY